MTLKDKILYYNQEYRKGNSLISDAEYDKLVDEYKSQVSPEEFNQFRKLLLDIVESNKYKFPFIAGSLDKKVSETDINKFVSKYENSKCNVTPKLDGISFIVQYKDGNLIGAYTRGNGYEGEIKTEKTQYINYIPKSLNESFTGYARGELVINKNSEEKIKSLGYKSLRNAVAGIINEKELNPEKLMFLDFVAYEIIDSNNKIWTDFSNLSKMGFSIPLPIIVTIKSDLFDVLVETFNNYKENYKYQIDGLVVSLGYKREEKIYKDDKVVPENVFAFKVNEEGIWTTLKDIIWNMSKEGNYIPLGIVEPIEVEGATIQRVSLYNAKYVRENRLAPGVEVAIIRSGDIIPKIVDIRGNENTKPTEPRECYSCGNKLIYTDTHIKCDNINCREQEFKKLVDFLRKLKIDGTDEKQLENLNIKTFKSLLRWTPNLKYKNEVKFEEELKTKLFTKTKIDLALALNWNGLNSKILVDLINKSGGWDKFVECWQKLEMTKATRVRIENNIQFNKEVIELITQEEIYTAEEVSPAVQITLDKEIPTICFTGKLSKPRKEFENLAKKAGMMVQSTVTKETQFLVAGEKAGSKLDKAKKLGTVTILTEEEFCEMYFKRI